MLPKHVIDIDINKLEDETVIKWSKDTKVTVQRCQFEDAVKSLISHSDYIAALRLIRAAYDCNLDTAKHLLRAIQG